MNRDPERRLEAMLVEVGEEVDWPAQRDLLPVVQKRIAAPGRPANARRPWLRPALALALGVAAFLTVGAFLFPDAGGRWLIGWGSPVSRSASTTPARPRRRIPRSR